MADIKQIQLPDSSIYDIVDAKAERTANKVASLSSSSTDTQYPSAKAVYDAIQAGGGGGSSPVSYTFTDPNADGNIIITQHVVDSLDDDSF